MRRKEILQMILSDSEMTKFSFKGDSFPLRCDLLVLEKIQERVGDIMDAENEIRGFKPRVDSDGVWIRRLEDGQSQILDL